MALGRLAVVGSHLSLHQAMVVHRVAEVVEQCLSFQALGEAEAACLSCQASVEAVVVVAEQEVRSDGVA